MHLHRLVGSHPSIFFVFIFLITEFIMVVIQEDAPIGSEFDLDGFIAGLDIPDDALDLHPMERERMTQLYLACTAKNWSPEKYTQLHTSVRLLLTSLEGLKRDNGDPSSTHSFEVAIIVLEEMNMGPDEVIGAILHDIPEDTKKRGTEVVTLAHIDRLFGPVMANRIDGLTKVKSSNNSDLLAQTHHKIFTLEQDDAPGVSIKLADRLHGMRTLQHLYPEKQKIKSGETLDTYVPLAYSLGYHTLAEELAYWSLYYLLPKDERHKLDSYKPGSREAITHTDSSIVKEFESHMTSILERYEGGMIFRVPSLFDRYRASGGNLEDLFDEDLPATAIITIPDVDLFAGDHVEGENSSAKAWKIRAMLVISHMHEQDILNDDQFLDLKKTIERNGKLIRYSIQVGGKLLNLRFVDPLYIHYQEASLADYIDSDSPLYEVAHDKVERRDPIGWCYRGV
jgi:hypothetical protein